MLKFQNIISRQAAQGDILLVEISKEDLPHLDSKELMSLEGPPIEGYRIIALGEATGHKHKIDAREGNVKIHKAANSERFFALVEKDTTLSHDEHNAIGLGTGIYEIIRQREATTDGRERVVAD
jgi:hypothetical protein